MQKMKTGQSLKLSLELLSTIIFPHHQTTMMWKPFFFKDGAVFDIDLSIFSLQAQVSKITDEDLLVINERLLSN